MKTYKQTFADLERAAVVPFFVIGDPDYETSLELVKTAIDAGADILELGIPFSDPIADGPTIQKADVRALKAGMTVQRALEFVRAVKEYKDVPIGLLMYYNLVYQYPIEEFFKDFHAAGVNSVLVADLSIDDADEITIPAGSAGLDTVFMVTPNTPEERMKTIAGKTTGFIYTVSLLGVTGAREQLSSMVEELVAKLKRLTDVPVCVGFGVSKPEHAATIASAGADGIIIGSRIVKIIEDNLNDKKKALAELGRFIGDIKAVLEKTGK
jgi:tryptophan synthase alpha chain